MLKFRLAKRYKNVDVLYSGPDENTFSLALDCSCCRTWITRDLYNNDRRDTKGNGQIN